MRAFMARGSTSGRGKRIKIAAVALCAAAASLAPVTILAASASAASNELPFVVTNNSGLNESAYVYIIGVNSTTGQQGYVDSSGNFNAWSYPSSIPNGPVPTPAFGIAGPASGGSETLNLPPDVAGGRVYISFGAQLPFSLTTSGLVEPAPWTSGDPSQNILFDWVEFARNASTGIDINSTMVDMFSVPLSVNVTSGGSTQTEGQLVSNGRANIFSQIQALGGNWPNLIYDNPSTGQPLRVISPLHGIGNGVFSSTYLDSYIDGVWSYYASHTLTVNTGSATYTGTTSGSSWTFKDSSGNVIGALGEPTTSNVFGCNGPLQPSGQANESATLAVGAIVCAALNRSTLSTSSFAGSDSQPTTNSAAFYTLSTSDLYAKVMHANEVDGKAYGFPYDDVAGFSPSIDDATATSAGLTVAPFTGSSSSSFPSGYQQLKVDNDGLCVDVFGASTANSAAIDQWGCKTSGQSNQEFQFNPISGGYGELQNQNSGLDINVSGASTASLAPVIQWTQDGAANALWLPIQLSDGSWQFQNKNSGLCLDVPGQSNTAGLQLEQYACKSGAAGTNQGFTAISA
jgi:Beta-1,3-glucanase/Ricin-type beta-trefoil lectin domain-like